MRINFVTRYTSSRSIGIALIASLDLLKLYYELAEKLRDIKRLKRNRSLSLIGLNVSNTTLNIEISIF